MKLIASKSFPHRGKQLRPGQRFSAPNRLGRVLVAIGSAKAAPREPVAAIEQESTASSDADPATTQESQQEPVQETPEAPAPEPVAEPEPPASDGQYSRRDMNAQPVGAVTTKPRQPRGTSSRRKPTEEPAS